MRWTNLLYFILGCSITIILTIVSDKAFYPLLMAFAVNQGYAYAIVAILGGLSGFLDIMNTYTNISWENILKTKGAKWWIISNIVIALIVFQAVKSTVTNPNLFLLSLGVGIGFPVLIRTKLIFSKAMNLEGKDLEINPFATFYDNLQEVFKRQIDFELRPYQKSRIRELFKSSVEKLYRKAFESVISANLLSREEKQKIKQELDEILRQSDTTLKKYDIIQIILDFDAEINIALPSETNQLSISTTSQPKEQVNLRKKLRRNCSIEDLLEYARGSLSSERLNEIENVYRDLAADEQFRKNSMIEIILQEKTIEEVCQNLLPPNST